MATIQVPSVGRCVAYYAYGTPGGEFPAGVARAAVVTEVDDPGNPESSIGICVLNPTGLFFNRGIAKAVYAGQPGCWDWPVYAPPVDVPEEEGQQHG
jgi:hypothetical protein